MVETDGEGRRLYKARGADGEVAWVDHDELWRLQQQQAQQLRREQARRRRRGLAALAALVALALVLAFLRLRPTAAPAGPQAEGSAPASGSPTEPAAAVPERPGANAIEPIGGVDPAAPAASGEPAAAAPGEAAANERRVAETVSRWAEAWTRRDVAAYLASYGDGFVPSGGATRASWERLRRRRLEAPAWIRVEVDDLRITLRAADRAEVSFRQSYRSPLYADVVRKRLVLAEEAGQWRIVDERAEPIAADRG